MHALTPPPVSKTPGSPPPSSTGKRGKAQSLIISFIIIALLLSVGAGTFVTTKLKQGSIAYAAPANTAVTTYKNDILRTGQNRNETILNTSNVNQNQFGKRIEYTVDGQVYAQPLYLPNVNIAGTVHNVVFVATEHDSLYAFDADQISSTPISTFLWHRSFINPPAVTTVSSSNVGCGDINPEYGITGTPVIDPSTNTLYVVANTLENGVNTYRLHAIDLTTGNDKPGSPTLIQASVQGSTGTVTFNSVIQMNRPGLLLLNGVVYIGWGSHCDNDIAHYHGWLMGYSASTYQQVTIYNDTLNGKGGAIWQSGQGIAADSSGNIYVMTGNGTFDVNTGGVDLGDSFIKLSTLGGLKKVDYFTPFNQSCLSAGDIDLGSGGPVLLPTSNEMVGAGKEGRVYVVSQANLGQYTPDPNLNCGTSEKNRTDIDKIVQELPPNTASGGVFGSPSYWNSPAGEFVYLVGIHDHVKAFRLNNGLLSTSASSQSPESFNYPGGDVAISSNGNTASSGIAWTIGPNAVLYAYDATNLAKELYNTSQNSSRDGLPSYTKFSVPTIANGEVFVGTHSTLNIYSLLSTPPPTSCPTNWSCADIGQPALAGSQSLSGGTWTIQGGGNDIWSGSDQFHFVWQSLAADGSASAHVLSQTVTSDWAKAGVMLRQSSDPGSAYYLVIVTPNHGINVQYRTAQGAGAQQLVAVAGTVPAYLKAARSGTTYTAYTSSDGNSWTAISGSSITLNMSGSILAGLAVTSHNSNALSTATFDTVSISTTTPPSSCPTNWSCADIGQPALAGSQSLSGGTWTIQGAGNDIWSGSDQFHFVWQSLAADGSASAHVLSQTVTSDWAKAGVMLRQSSNPGSAYYLVAMTPNHGINVQYRTAQGAGAQQLVAVAGTVPAYLKAARSGTTYTAYTSSDGNSWTAISGSSITLNMSGSILAGLAVTSHNSNALSTATFDTVSISTTTPPSSCPTNWSCADIGHPALAGSQSLSGGTWTIQGGGNDIWSGSDQFHFVWQSLAADGSASAHVLSQTVTNDWAKAGVMLRQSSDPGSAYYLVIVTPNHGINVQYRTAQGAGAQQLVAVAGTVPAYLKVARSGTTYTAYTSSDGNSWTAISGSSITLNMSGSILAGLAVTSHNSNALSTATFDTVSISTTVP
ncbi:hypothetical protein [Dictyobacter formicarum]|uniref:DUF1349 domain-containing protein n=1 Tax=Dictyobacter formicarum TaxID=2778368 RepID=A0ABQ3VNR1_9CHLR|nr:hypothetical protein [Dictyobacter formicarum]GHO87884.1 hypothetical protein KSZ_58900 [Dictyobacter formicarum]